MEEPVFLDLGSKSRKAIKKLKRKRGKLMTEVEQSVEDVSSRLGSDAKNKQLIPIVIIYRRKRKRKANNFPFPFPFRFN